MKLTLGNTAPVVVQLALAMVALGVVTFAPPAQGRMLLVPLDGKTVDRATIADRNATPLKAGPLPGSWVVDAERDDLRGLWAERVLVLAAPAALCAEDGSGASSNG